MTEKNILYITRNGLLEPLAQSQVFSYLKGLSKNYKISLISFEKPEDRDDRNAFDAVQRECDKYGIRWLPQRFHHHPRYFAPAWSMVIFTFLCLREVIKGKVDLIHTRSYLPAAVALFVFKLTGTPFVFDMRALWPEELITAGRLSRGSVMHRVITFFERACLKNAAAVVSLTNAAVDYLQEVYPQELANQRVVVIPTCADLDRFVPVKHLSGADSVPAYGCLGTVLSGWFRLDWLRMFLVEVASRDSSARFEIVTRDDPDEVRRRLGFDESLSSRLKIYPMPSQKVHKAVQQHSASIMFYAGGEISELGRSPTRMAEILGCGLPVVANSGVGDVAQVIEKYRVGVLLTKGTSSAMVEAIDRLEQLMKDPELSNRCRQAAEEVFSLESGTQAYRKLYRLILSS